MLAAHLGRRTVAVIRALLGQLGMGPSADGHTVERHVAEYNKLLAQAREERMHLNAPSELQLGELPLDDPEHALTKAASLLLEVEATVDELWSANRRPAAAGALIREGRDVAVLMWDVMGSSTADPADVGEVIHQVNQQIERSIRQRGGEGFRASQDDGNSVIMPSVVEAVEAYHELRTAFEGKGYLVRGAIESTMDADKLQRNSVTGEYNGRPYQIAARVLAAFKEALAANAVPAYVNARGEDAPLVAPSCSYLNVTARTLAALGVEGGGSQPDDTALHGIIRGFTPRVASTVPTEVHCFVARS
jgi:hypothetical protein